MEDTKIIILGDYTKSVNGDEALIDMTKKAYNRAVFAMCMFINNLGIDPSIFKHLYNLDIVLNNRKYMIDKKLAGFFSVNDKTNEPEIHISYKYVDDLLNYSKVGNRYDEALNILSKTIIHEMLHCNRSIILNDKYFIKDYKLSKNKYNLVKKDDKKINELDKKLDYLLSTDKSLLEEDDIVVSNRTYGNINETVIYDNINNCYNIYYMDLDSENILDEVSKFTKPSRVIKVESDNPSLICSDYDLNNENIDNKTFLDDIVIYNRIMKQLPLEEQLTEAFAELIIKTRNDSNLDLDKSCDSLINNKDILYDVRQMHKMIKTLGIDFAKWFITSCYMDEYDNYLERELGIDYIKLLNNEECIYRNIMNETDDDYSTLMIESSRKNIEKILDRKMSK